MREVFSAPAKVNLCLRVLGRRADGYHDLLMLMQQVSLADEVEIVLRDEVGVRVACSGLALAAGEENIAARAARAVLGASDYRGGVSVRIDKRIPVAAGLGGGSSDAAAVLCGLNRMLGAPLSQRQLLALGARLGADVPFFVFGAAAWARGVGDLLDEVPALPPVWYVLVNPGFAVSTAWVYGNLGLTSPGDVAKLPEFSGSTGDLLRLLHNDLEPVTLGRFPEVGRIKDALLQVGALGALMSGSGPTVFGVFSSEEAAGRACEQLSHEKSWRIFKVHPLGLQGVSPGGAV